MASSVAPAPSGAVRPAVSAGLLIRATRAPFLTATLAPVLLGLAVAARAGSFDPLTALLTLVAAAFIHFGLNVANDVFDTILGADDANPTPTRFSGGSRVLQDGLLAMRGMSLLGFACYAVGAAIGLVLLALRPSPELLLISAIGVFISLAYTAPPFKLVYRGLGEIATFLGFGPVMLLGTYAVQTRGSLSLEALLASVPVAFLVAMILYVNEIPDRVGDASVGKRTLPVRWSRRAVVWGWDVSVGGAFISVVAGVLLAVLPWTALLVLLALPLARRVHAGIVAFYDEPYALMPAMARNIGLHMTVGALLVAGYVAALAIQSGLGLRPFLF